MAMFEVEGKSKITATDSTTTEPTLIKSTGENSQLTAKVKNCHSGLLSTPESQPLPKSIWDKTKELIIENFIQSAFGLAVLFLIAYFGLSS